MLKKYTILIATLFFMVQPSHGMSYLKDILTRNSSETNPEMLIPEIENALEHNEFQQAAKLMVEYKIRVHLDVTCCTDPSSAAAGDALTIRQLTNPKFKKMAKHVSKRDLNTTALETIARFEKELASGTMPQPEWVGKYGMNKYVGCSKDGLFIARSECREKQLALLEKYKTDLSEV